MSATFLHERHINLGARMTSFAGWDMPLHYGSQILEHRAVREQCGLFDVSHMLTIDITGRDARNLVRKIYSNDPDKSTAPGTGLYGFILNEQGFVLDDMICYVINEEYYRLIVNASRREVDSDWITGNAAGMNLSINKRTDSSIIAVQGPKSLASLVRGCPALTEVGKLKRMQGMFVCDDMFIARSGYTGEDGFEIIGSSESLGRCWDALIAAGIQPCGLGARDSLRLEAGLCLYGNELSESISPLEAGMNWAVDWSDPERSFIGKVSLAQQKQAGCKRTLVGLVLLEKGIMRANQSVFNYNSDKRIGTITSGGFSPVLQTSIALALIDARVTDRECLIRTGDNSRKAIITKKAFVRYGKKLININ